MVGCSRPSPPAPEPPPVLVTSATASARAEEALPAVSAAPSAAPAAPAGVARERYAWLADERPGSPPAVEELRARFAPPPGFVRREAPDGSFGAWLSRLPLTAKGTPVLTYEGKELRPANHPNVAAVVAIDIGTADLQQCADSVIRMHAEHTWVSGRRDAISYRAAAGLAMPWTRWSHGERVVPEGKMSIAWALGGKPADDHATFRKYLDSVFTWANTVSLAKEAKPVALADLEAGDFVVLPGNPGHAVLVLDVATNEAGRLTVLLGQGYMPAQSFHVLFPDRGAREETASAWFLLDPAAEGVKTPFWPVFPWSALRRLPR